MIPVELSILAGSSVSFGEAQMSPMYCGLVKTTKKNGWSKKLKSWRSWRTEIPRTKKTGVEKKSQGCLFPVTISGLIFLAYHFFHKKTLFWNNPFAVMFDGPCPPLNFGTAIARASGCRLRWVEVSPRWIQQKFRWETHLQVSQKSEVFKVQKGGVCPKIPSPMLKKAVQNQALYELRTKFGTWRRDILK